MLCDSELQEPSGRDEVGEVLPAIELGGAPSVSAASRVSPLTLRSPPIVLHPQPRPSARPGPWPAAFVNGSS